MKPRRHVYLMHLVCTINVLIYSKYANEKHLSSNRKTKTFIYYIYGICQFHGVQRKMISVDTFFVFLRLLFFALLLLFVT